MSDDPTRSAPDPDVEEEELGAGELPDTIDVQPEDPDYPGRDSPDPID